MWLTNLNLVVPDLVLVNSTDYHWGSSAIHLAHLDGDEVNLLNFILYIRRISVCVKLVVLIYEICC